MTVLWECNHSMLMHVELSVFSGEKKGFWKISRFSIVALFYFFFVREREREGGGVINVVDELKICVDSLGGGQV